MGEIQIEYLCPVGDNCRRDLCLPKIYPNRAFLQLPDSTNDNGLLVIRATTDGRLFAHGALELWWKQPRSQQGVQNNQYQHEKLELQNQRGKVSSRITALKDTDELL